MRRTLTFLGTGTSVGVPVIGCACDVCASTNPRNSRYRASVLMTLPGGNLLIDTGPEVRLQLVREKIATINAVLYTHYHVDHLFGLDDLRIVANRLDAAVPLYCTDEVEGVIRHTFAYAFDPLSPPGSVPRIEFRRITDEPFAALGELITPVPLEHSRFKVHGFRVGDLAYCTDVSRIPDPSMKLLEGLDTLVIDCLRYKSHPAHMGVNDVLEVVSALKPKRTLLTHMSHEFDFDHLSRELPPGVEPAYDGMRVEF